MLFTVQASLTIITYFYDCNLFIVQATVLLSGYDLIDEISS